MFCFFLKRFYFYQLITISIESVIPFKDFLSVISAIKHSSERTKKQKHKQILNMNL